MINHPRCPKISVVIATFNAEATVSEAMQSVLNQSYRNVELILMDGISTDKTAEIISSFRDDRVVFVSERDGGIYDAWNKGVRKATGEWVMFIGADDYLENPKCLENFLLSAAVQSELVHANIIYSDLVVLGENGIPMDRIGGEWRNPHCFLGRHAWVDFPIPIMASIFRRKELLRSGGFDITLRIIADIDAVLRQSKEVWPKYVPGYDITVMGYGGVSTKPQQALNLLRESYIVRRRHRIGTFTNLGFLQLGLRQYLKYCIMRFAGKGAASVVMRVYQDHKRKRMFGAKKC